ncbi:MAG: addiction module protein [Abditibacteriaceae bacterium]
MPTFAELEKEVLNLPPVEREMLALAAWESIQTSGELDAEGIEIAHRRDQEIESGAVRAISHEEFMRRTRGNE